MSYMIIRHQVKDYEQWKPIYDEGASLRQSFGSQGAQLFRSTTNPSEIVAVFKWDSLENAHRYAASHELHEKMARAGVSDRPDIYFVEEVELQPA